MKAPGVPIRIAIAAGVLAAALVGLVVREGAARDSGQEVRLEITGYDPRSLLTGHYVQFQISSAAAGRDCSPLRGQRGWLALAPRGERHIALADADTREEAEKLGQIAVRGTMTCITSPAPTGDTTGFTATILDLGIDRFHASQEQAEAFEKALRGADGQMPEAHVVVSVGADGRARLKALVIEDQRADLDWF